MNVLNWVHSGEVVALGWTLLHFCWQSAIIALLYALVDRCLFRATTAVHYGVAMTMLGLMPLAAIASLSSKSGLLFTSIRVNRNLWRPRLEVCIRRLQWRLRL